MAALFSRGNTSTLDRRVERVDHAAQPLRPLSIRRRGRRSRRGRTSPTARADAAPACRAAMRRRPQNASALLPFEPCALCALRTSCSLNLALQLGLELSPFELLLLVFFAPVAARAFLVGANVYRTLFQQIECEPRRALPSSSVDNAPGPERPMTSLQFHNCVEKQRCRARRQAA